MNHGFVPKLGLNSFDSMSNPFQTTLSGKIHTTSLSPLGTDHQLMGPQGLRSIEGVQGPSFKNVLDNTLSSVNKTLAAPDALMQEAMVTGNVDVHDVMIANAKSELVVSIAAQMTTKVIQAYDRILQIQI